MAYDRARCDRLARAIASDTMVYMKDSIDQGLEEDTLFDLLKDNLDENRKNMTMRMGDEAAASNALARAFLDVVIVPMGAQKKYSIF